MGWHHKGVLKRLIWWTAGAVMGAGGSTWLQRKVKRTVQAKVAAIVPAAVLSSVTEKAKGVSSRAVVAVKGAVADGRLAARDREQELRADLERKRITSRH
jgi:hypothetical protein